MSEEKIEQVPDDENILNIRLGINLPREDKYYFNGFSVQITAQDFSLVLLQNTLPIALTNTPHSIAKSMALTILNLIENFEKASGEKIYSLEEIQKAIEEKNAK